MIGQKLSICSQRYTITRGVANAKTGNITEYCLHSVNNTYRKVRDAPDGQEYFWLACIQLANSESGKKS